MKYIKPPSKTVLHVSDARTKHGISLPARSCLPSFMEQRAAFEEILTTFEESRGHAQQCLVDNTKAPRSYGYILLPEKLSPRQQWFQSTPRVPYYERADSEWRYRVVLEKYQAAEERYRVAGEQYQAAEEPYQRVSKERKQAAEEWYAAAEERYQAVEELFQAASEQCEVASQKYEAASKQRCRVKSLQRYEAASWRYKAASERQRQVTRELKDRPLMGCSPPISMGWIPADIEWYQAAGMEWYQAAFERHEAASKQRCRLDSLPRYQAPSRWYQGILEQWCRAAEEQCRATSKRYHAAKQEYEAASKLECPADSQRQDRAKQRHQKALKWYHVALEQQYQATLEQRYRAAEKRWHAAEEQYQAAEEQWQAVEKRYEAAEGQWQAACAQYHGTVKQVVSTLVLVSWYLQETLEDIRSAFEDFQAAFKQLPRVRLNPPPIFLRVVGPISMDLRPFHRGKNMYSLGSMFLESLMCDFWISWDLRSYEVLVAAKSMHKGRLYPTAFTSKLSLLVKRLIKANLQFALQSYDKGRRGLTLKSLAESAGLGARTTPTFRAGHDALIRGAVEGSSMQRSLIATISLGVRNLTSCITPIGERAECFGGFAEIWRAQLTSSNGKFSVAVKYLRLCVTEVTKHLYREIRIWQSLEHPHVLPLLGICYNANTYESIRASGEHIVDPMVSIGIVCPWMVNGTLVDYLKHGQTKAENIELRLRLLIQVCSGLMYFHSKNIVHGDLHGGNILVDSTECARLADFGLSAVVAECRGTSRTGPGGISSPHGGALRWAAPELFLPGGAKVCLHPSTDIYSIGGLILQACTGDVPYSYYNERCVLGAIITGEKPRCPTSEEANISDALWSVIEECWQDDPLERPTAAALESRLQVIYSGLGGEQA